MEILNRKANFNYEILERIECGIVLKGTEIKSIRMGKANIKDSYGIIKNNEVFILNMHISPYEQGNIFNVDMNIRIMFMVTFFLTRMIIGKPKHYNKAYRCAL